MALTPKHKQVSPLKSEQDLDRVLQYFFSHLDPGKEDESVCHVNSREYDLSVDQIMELGKQAGYDVSVNGGDSLTVDFN